MLWGLRWKGESRWAPLSSPALHWPEVSVGMGLWPGAWPTPDAAEGVARLTLVCGTPASSRDHPMSHVCASAWAACWEGDVSCAILKSLHSQEEGCDRGPMGWGPQNSCGPGRGCGMCPGAGQSWPRGTADATAASCSSERRLGCVADVLADSSSHASCPHVGNVLINLASGGKTGMLTRASAAVT